MTVYAHIMTTKVINKNGAISLNFSNQEGNDKLVDVWFVTISESLSNKTDLEVKEILDIRDYGVWVTTPYNNLFWIVTNLDTGFNIKELASADLGNVYDKFEVSAALLEKADINHTHTTDDIIDFEEKVDTDLDIMSDDISLFIDNLTQAFINN